MQQIKQMQVNEMLLDDYWLRTIVRRIRIFFILLLRTFTSMLSSAVKLKMLICTWNKKRAWISSWCQLRLICFTSLKRNNRFTQFLNHVHSTSFNSHHCVREQRQGAEEDYRIIRENNQLNHFLTLVPPFILWIKGSTPLASPHTHSSPFPESAFRITISSFE